MSNVWLIAGRELKAHLRSRLGYLIAAAVLLVDGIWFMTKALGGPEIKRLSADVLFEFFHGASGVSMLACVVLSMRLLAQEQELGTIVLLRTAPIRDRDLVLGKFLAGFIVMTGITTLTAYMPALIFVNGRVSVGHILVGYLGLLLLIAATMAIGLLGSALARTQVVAVLVGAVLVGTMLLLWMVARETDPPINEFVGGLALHHNRQRPFMTGVLRFENVVYYVAVTFFFLMAAIKTLEARRWR